MMGLIEEIRVNNIYVFNSYSLYFCIVLESKPLKIAINLLWNRQI